MLRTGSTVFYLPAWNVSCVKTVEGLRIKVQYIRLWRKSSRSNDLQEINDLTIYTKELFTTVSLSLYGYSVVQV